MSTADLSYEVCPVCDGSQLLLGKACPLCVDDVGPEAARDLTQDNECCQQIAGSALAAPAPKKAQPRLQSLPTSHLCLVLDIDGTLLAESDGVCPASMASMLRPHLDEFLDFAFATFSAVALWTAATRGWLDAFLKAADPEGRRPWAFTWSYERISWQLMGAASKQPYWQHVKRLRKIWQSKPLRAIGFSPATTLLVDNSPPVCLANYGCTDSMDVSTRLRKDWKDRSRA